ncbi:Flagellar hook protein FlgE [Polaromonas vacuolata]|uniref:Flagellar hook protein FlgE n=1 Tax=Polaromonas vacuolata TaxID=37448 RepID=A0A6H2H5U3_9BURK|nr:flagellar hook protein FlgE [Polaromonas vacuolata]QJC55137.1 Flagellar hook protein FlgE [Polaromonas vacuolata]
MGFAQGVSGLTAAASNLDVIGNNISNSGTIGFKSGTAQFSDVYAGSAIGLGTEVSTISQNFNAGSIQTSSKPLDMAIVGGDGFFRTTSASGEISFTRNGQFNADKEGFIVNAGGSRLTGFAVDATGGISGGAPKALVIPTAAIAPNPTSTVTAQFNIDSRSVTPTVTAFDANNSNSYNYANSLTVFDSLGNSHELSTFFAKDANVENGWNVYVTADGYPLNSAGEINSTPPPPSPPPATANSEVSATLVFNTNGTLKSVTPTGGAVSPTSTFNITGLDFGNGAAALTTDITIAGTTQFGTTNDVKALTQNGFTSGQLTSFAIGVDGKIQGKYSNEQTKLLGQVVVSSFANPNGLISKGGNSWSQSPSSGQPLTVVPGAGTKSGSISSGSLEGSNVDLTSELVNLVIAQRTYQANAQTVKTQDQVLQTLINIR